jgi:carbonic anhydrase
LAVLGVFYELVNGPIKNPYFSDAKHVVDYDSNYIETLDLFSIKDMIMKNKFEIYTYLGSLTTPNCNPTVTWMVSTIKIPISSADLSLLRKLKNHENERLKETYRPVQPLLGRNVTYFPA